MTKVAVLDDWQGVAQTSADWTKLQARAEVVFFSDAFENEAEAVRSLTPFDIILSMRERTPLPGTLINQLPQLKFLGITGARNLSLDLAACTARGVLVSYTTSDPKDDSAKNATAELALALLLSAARSVPVADAGLRAGRFQQGVPVGMTLAGKTLGVIGLGTLGAKMARYGRALEMKVLAWSPNLTEETASASGAERVTKEALLARSDAVSLHVVLSPRSRGMIGATELALMKPGAILINTSRGPLVDEPALLEAVRAGRIFAGLDVFDQEPLPPTHPLRSLPNTVLTPHLGYCVAETWRQFYPQSVENALAYLDGKPVRVMNPEILSAAAGGA